MYTTCSPHVLQKEELLTKIYLTYVRALLDCKDRIPLSKDECVYNNNCIRFMFIKIFCWLTLVNIKKRKQNKSRFTFNERTFLVFNCSKAKQVRTFPLKSKFPASQGRFLLSMNTTKSLIQNRHWKLGHKSAYLEINYLGFLCKRKIN